VKRGGQTRVTCLGCGAELRYDWNKMQIEDVGKEGANKTERITGDRGGKQ
jgi:RNase P subunit RPR2